MLNGNNIATLDGSAILITGGTGSFGRAFVHTVLERYDVRRIVIFSRDEFKQYEMEQEIPAEKRSKVRFFIGDVRDRDRLEMALRDIDYVIHAAALKHVPAAEYNPFECIRTNVIGAENVVRASIAAGVKRVVALSTDKAANPVNLYGASKLAADKIFVAAHNFRGHSPITFSVVRYGNVIGSRGSVVPFFQKLIAEKAESLPITDERMTRYWITLDKGVDFVLNCLQTMYGGEIFVPKLPSMRIVELARTMAPHLPLRHVGIRPGEKLHETLITVDDARDTYDLGDRYVIEPAFAGWERRMHKDDPGVQKVAEDFHYISDKNDSWMTADDLHRMVAEKVR